MELLQNFNEKKFERIQEREDIIDKMEERVTKYLVDLGNLELSDEENTGITTLIRIQSEFEKVGDYTYRLAKTIEQMKDREIELSPTAQKEIKMMYDITNETVLKTIQLYKERDLTFTIKIEALKEIAESRREKYKIEHIQRLKEGTCNVESGISFLEILAVFEKIVYHCVNISIAISNFVTNETFIMKEAFCEKMYRENSDVLKNMLNEYSLKYVE